MDGDEDGCAQAFLSLEGLDGLNEIDAWGVVVRFGIDVRPLPSGMVDGYFRRIWKRTGKGKTRVLRLTIFVLFCRDEREVQFRLAHELAHLALLCWGVRLPHVNEVVNRVARALLMPRWTVERMLRAGADVATIAKHFEVVPPRQVELRAQEVGRTMRRIG